MASPPDAMVSPRAAVWTRRDFLVGSAAAGAIMAGPSSHANTHSARTLRFVPHADLKILDPVWTSAYIVRNHGYMVYDTLFATDGASQIRPQMVETYSISRNQREYRFTLRDGLRFHDGQPVTAEDCVISLRRWGKRDPLGKLLFAATESLRPVDRKTFTLTLGEPFGLVLDALGKPSSNVPFIMPAGVAGVSDSEQIKDAVGSGPYRFVKDDWQPGHQVVYVRNGDYVPRSEPPSGAAGGKQVHVDRVVWRYLPDPATAAAALEAGEIDYWELPPADFAARAEQNRSLNVFLADPQGGQGCLRPNHLHPPFDHPKARQALLWMMDQTTYLQAVVGHPKYYRTCPAYFMCAGSPYESAVGAPPGQDLARAKALLREAGYDGRPVVLLDPTDLPLLHAATLVGRDLLLKIGVNVDLQAMDWSTLTARRARKDPPARGGWNLLHTFALSADIMTPAVNSMIAGTCDTAWFGWYCSERMEKLRTSWIRAVDQQSRQRLAEEIQKVAYEEVPHVPWGQVLQPRICRRDVRGILTFPAPVLWNISIAR